MESRKVIYTHENAMDCPCCGDTVEVLTSLSDKEIEQGLYMDGDEVTCVDPYCDMERGQVSCDEDSCYITGDF